MQALLEYADVFSAYLTRSSPPSGRTKLAISCTILSIWIVCYSPVISTLREQSMSTMQELRALIARHAGAERPATVHTRIPGLIVAASYEPPEPIHQVFEPVFVLVAQGSK